MNEILHYCWGGTEPEGMPRLGIPSKSAVGADISECIEQNI